MADQTRQPLQRGRGRPRRPHCDRLWRVRRAGNLPHRREGTGAVPPRGRHHGGSLAAGVRAAPEARSTAMNTRIGLRRLARVLALALAVMLSFHALALDTTVLPDAQKQARYEALTHELRCMQCMNNSIADSPVGLASDLRRDVAEMLVAGKSDDEIRAYMVQRYGNVILFTPPFRGSAIWVWLTPLAALAGGIVVAVVIVRRRGRLVTTDVTDEPPR